MAMEVEEVLPLDPDEKTGGGAAAAAEPSCCFQEVLEQQRACLLQRIDEVLAEHFCQLQQLEPRCSRVSCCSLNGDHQVQCLNSLLSGGASPASVASLLSAGLERQVSYHSFGSTQVMKEQTARHTVPADLPTLPLAATKEVERWTQRLVGSDRFEWACTMLILSNTFFYGVEAQCLSTAAGEEYVRLFGAVSKVYTALFTLEVLLRVLANCRSFFCSRQWLWNIFDALIVACSLAELLSPDVPHISFMRIVRLTRTVRLYRTVQYLRVFTGLRILVSSVLATLRSLAWTLLLLASILYVFGLLFTQTAMEYLRSPERDPEVAEALRAHFGSLLRTVLTLFKCITSGLSWEEASTPLGAVHPVWECVFCAFIAFTCLAVLNVVTGVFCQSAIESANRDKDGIVQHQMSIMEKYTSELKHLFRQIDSDNKGVVTLTMFEESLKDSQMKAYFEGLDMSCDDAWNLFKLLDKDESNGVDIEEFVKGCLKLQGSARSIDTHMLLYESRWAMKRLHEISHSLRLLGETCASNLPRRPSLLLPVSAVPSKRPPCVSL